MNALETYHNKLDSSDYDCLDEDNINNEFQEVIKKLIDDGDQVNAHFAEIDRQSFAINKSFDFDYKDGKETKIVKGLSWKFSGTQTYQDGREEPFVWPDISLFKKDDFQYLASRFKQTRNLYAKVEYGLILFFKPPSPEFKHHQFKAELSDLLFKLAKFYLNKVKGNGEKNYYILYYRNILKGSLYVAIQSNNSNKIDSIADYIYKYFRDWDVIHNNTLSIVLDHLSLFSQYYFIFKDLIDINNIYTIAYTASRKIENNNLHGCISICESCLNLENKSGIKSKINWKKYKAEVYEKLAKDAIEKGNINVVSSFVQNAMNLYGELKIVDELNRIEKWYSDVRNQVQMSTIKQELPKEYTDHINVMIKKTIDNNDSFGILDTIAISPMFGSINDIRLSSAAYKSGAVLTSMIPLTIIDKFGNKIKTYNPDDSEDGYDSNFWHAYGYNYQLGSQALFKLIVQSCSEGKLSYLEVKKYLSKNWFGKEWKRNYVNGPVEIRPIDTILPSIKQYFRVLNHAIKKNRIRSELVLIEDSMTLKIEYIIRLMHEILGLPTFKQKKYSKDDTNIVMEKTLEDLLSKTYEEGSFGNNAILREEDRLFIKFVLSEKAGENIRNRVAHGLMDINEYDIRDASILFSIIIRLSNYSFK